MDNIHVHMGCVSKKMKAIKESQRITSIGLATAELS